MATVTSFPDDPSAISVPRKPTVRSDLGDLERILPAGRQRRRFIPGGIIGKGLGPLALIVLWCTGTSYGWISPDLLPGPQTLWATLTDLISSGDLSDALVLSLQRVAVGFCFGFVTGVGLALVSGLFRLGERSEERRVGKEC